MNKLAFVLMFLMATSFMPFSAFAQEANSMSSSSTSATATTVQSSSTNVWSPGQDLYYSLNGGAISFDGDTGGVTIFDQQGILIDSDSYTVRAAEINTDEWSNLSTNDADFIINEYYNNMGENMVTITREDQTGKFITEYILTPSQGKIKTTVYFTNYSLPNHKIAFTETLQLVKDIEINGQPLDLDQYIGVTFDRQVLEQNQDIVIQARDSVYYAGPGFDKLWAVSVHENRMISLDYAGVDETQTAIGETTSLDPTIILAPTNVVVTQDPVTGEVTVDFDAGQIVDGFTGTSSWLQTIGTGGASSANGGFYTPQGLHTDSNDNIYVGDWDNGRAQKFDSDGNWLVNYSGVGRAHSVAVDSTGDVYVSDIYSHLIKKYDNAGNYLSTISGGFNKVGGMDTNSNDDIYICSQDNHTLKVYNSSGSNIANLYGFNYCVSVYVDNADNVYAFDESRIVKIWDSNHTLLSTTNISSQVNGYIGNIAVDSSGNIYISETSGIIDVYPPMFSSTTPFATIGSIGTGNGQFTNPFGMDFTSDGTMWVADRNNHRIQQFMIGDISSPTAYDVFSKGAGTNYRSHEFENKSWNFDASSGNGYGVTTNAVNTSVDQTYSMWLKFPLVTTNYQWASPVILTGTSQSASCWYPNMFDKGVGGNAANHWLGTYKCSGGGFTSSGFDLKTLSSGWHHLTTVVDGGTLVTHYIDGVQVGTNGATSGYYPQGGVTVIGDTWNGGKENIGHMDDLGVWNTTLSQSDITSLAQGASPNNIQTNNLLQYYNFEQTGTSLPNLATGTASLGSSADGTLVNGTTGQPSYPSISTFQITAGSGDVAYTIPPGGIFNGIPSNYNIHTFTGSGNFQITSGSGDVEYLVVAGGGGAGSRIGGGGGGGGVLTGTSSNLGTGTYTVTVGGGGAGGVSNNTGAGGQGTDGDDSVFDTLTALGGGGGGRYLNGSPTQGSDGSPGGSGGGAGGQAGSGNTGGAGTGGQGYDGGAGTGNSGAGGGGGAGGVGGTATSGSAAGEGGIGLGSYISGTLTYYAGGGGGSSDNNNALGGLGGGGQGGAGNGNPATAGTANTGGGAGGQRPDNYAGLTGGSGIVIIKYDSSQITATGGTITSPPSPTITGTASNLGVGTYSVTGNVTLVYDDDEITATGGTETTWNIPALVGQAAVTVQSGGDAWDLADVGEIDINIPMSSDHTIGMWVNFPLPSPTIWTDHTFVPSTTNGHYLYSDAGNVVGYYSSGGQFFSTGYSLNSVSNGWHHLALTSDHTNTQTKVWIDGVQVGNTLNSVKSNGVAMDEISNINQGIGKVDDFTVWNTPLTASELLLISTGTNPDTIQTNNLLVYFNMEGTSPLTNQATGSSALSITGSANGTVLTGVTSYILSTLDTEYSEIPIPGITEEYTVTSSAAGDLGSSVDGTNNGATTGVTGKIGNAWDFDGSNDNVSIPSNASIPMGTEPFTYNIWVNPDNFTGYNVYYSLGTGATNQALYITNDGNQNDGNIEVHRYGGVIVDSGSSAIAVSIWTMLTLTYDGTTAKLFFDGVQVGSNAYAINTTNNGITFGDAPQGSHQFDGKLDAFTMYDDELTASEISSLYNSGNGTTSPPTSGLLAYYDFEQTGSTLTNVANVVISSELSTPSPPINTFNVPLQTTNLQSVDGSPIDLSWYATGTGASVIQSAPFKVHTFTGSSNFQITNGSGDVEYLIVAGGGGSGARIGGGGAGGGMLEGTSSNLGAGIYTVTVGTGGAGGIANNTGAGGQGTNGADSVFDTITALGGGGGGRYVSPPNNGVDGSAGGSGGGAGGIISSGVLGGAGTSGQGYAGGTGATGASGAGGGGGAGGIGGTATSGSAAGVGGIGLQSDINGILTYYAGGGGGSSDNNNAPGGLGGGGQGGAGNGNPATGGTNELGGGAGGQRPDGLAGTTGGSGIVIVRYADDGSITATGGTVTTVTSSSLISSPPVVSYNVIRDGLVIDTLVGTTTVTDHYTHEFVTPSGLGTSADGTTGGATTGVTGKIGNAWDFGGTDSHEVATNDPVITGSGDFTISTWINGDTISAGMSAQSLLRNHGNTVNTDGFEYYLRYGIPTFYTSSGWQSIGSALSSNTWYHLTLVRESGVVSNYVDGVSQGSFNNSHNITGSDDLYIGGANNYTLSNFDGTMDDTGIWNKALTSAEINSLYNSGNGQTPINANLTSGLLAYYDFEQTGSTLTNQAPTTQPPFQITAGTGDVGYTIQPDGIFNGITSDGWGVTNTSYDNKSINVSSQENAPSGISFKPDGTGMFIAGAGADTVFYYTLSTAWDVSTASYSNTSFYVGNQDGVTRDIFFKPDGTEMYMVGYGTDEVFKYNLSTAWDISTASYSNTSFYVGTQEGAVMEVTFKPDGTKMYVTGFANNTIYEYNLSTAWDISTTSYANKSFSVASQEPSVYGVTFHPDGTEMYVVGDNGYIYIYALTSAWDVTTASYTVSYHVGGQEAYPNDVAFSTDGLKMYVAGHNTDTVFQYSTPSTKTGTINLGVGSYNVTGDVTLTYDSLPITATGGTSTYTSTSVTGPPPITYTDSNIVIGQTYVYEITAGAVVGSGLLSLSSSALAGIPPVAPTNLAASTGVPIVLTWTQSPDPDPAIPVTHYTIERSLNGSTWSTLNSNVGNVSTYSDNTVTPGTLYHYQVAAVNALGTSPFSTPTSAIAGSPPSQPQNLVVVQTTTNQLDLSWQIPSNNGNVPITNYKIYRDASLIATVGNVLVYNDTTPAIGTQYIYHVTAVNAAGESTNSNSIIITSWDVPDVPTNATATGGIPIVVNWSAPGSSDKPVINYKVYRDGNLLITLGNVLTYSDSNVTPNTTYVYRISAVSIVGESIQSNPTSGQSGVPPAQITTFTVTALDASRIQLDWAAPNDNGYPISGYNIYRSGALIGTTAGLTYIDTGLQNNTTYTYTVAAENVGGEGTQSASQSATTSTPLSPPTNVYTEEHVTSVTVSWDDVLNAVSYTVERDGSILTTTASFIYTDTTAVAGTGYIYKVYANSSVINGLVGTSNTVTTAPSTPHQYITVTPVPPANNAYPIDKYQMYRNNIIVGYVAPNTDYVDHDLAIGTTYTYAIKAHNLLGWSQLSPLTSITTWDVPDQITQFSGTTGSPIILDWIAPASDRPITLYTIYRDSNLLATTTSITYSDTTVVAGITYVYTVTATSHVGEGVQSAGLSLQAGTVPTAPTLTLAVLANNQIRMDWTVPSSNGGVAISGYNPQVSTDNGVTWADILSNPTTALTLLNQNLTQGQNYTYQVAAVNAVGISPYSTPLSAISGDKPDQVTGVNTTPISDTKIDIDWIIPANNSYAITGYNLFRSTDQVNWTTVSTTINTNSYSDTGLTADTVYYYKISATNVLGTGAESSVVSQRTFGLPDPVTTLVLTSQGTGQINTSWTQPNLNGFPLVSYTVERSTNGTSGWTTILSGSTNTTFNDTTGLVQNTVYYYRVTTTTTYGSTTGTVVNATTHPVATNLVTATTQSNTSIQINWNAIAGNGTVQYDLERSTNGTTWSNVTLLITGTTYTDTGLTPLTQYQYRVTSVNSGGSSAPSIASAPVTTFAAPEPPTNLTLLALLNAEIQLDWIAPTVTNGAPVTSYNIERSTNGTTWSTLVNNVNTLNYTDTGLTTSQVYHYRVAANSIYGTSVFSAPANAMASDVPSQVTGLIATTLPNFEIQLDWATPNSNGYNISGYIIERSTDGGTTWNILVANTQNTNIIYTDINLTVSQVYHYRISAINQVGTGVASATANATAGDVPSANVLTATPVAPGQIDLSWTVPNSNGFTLTKYTVNRSLDGITWTTIASVLPSVGTTHSDTGLTIGTLYYYNIATENAVGFSVASNVESLNAGDVPGIATNLTGITQSDTQILLNWTSSIPNGYPVTGYKIEQSINNSVWTVLVADTQSTQISYTVSSLTPATDYYYRVSGINQLGTSAVSNTALVHTFGPPEPVTSVTPVATSTSVTLNWVAPYDHGSAITGYKIEVKDFVTGNWLNLTTVQTTTYTQVNMIPNTLYEYQITAINQYGTSVSQTIPVNTLATAPATPTVTTISGTELKVEWPVVSGTGITYTIYTSSDDITFTAGPVGHPTAYFNHQGLTNGQTVYYKITILNSSGESPQSSSASATTWTTADAPTNLQISNPTPLSALLTWVAPTNDGGDSANLSYTVQRSNDNLNWMSFISTTATTATDNSLVISTQYYWRVNSVNSVGIGGTGNTVSYLTPGLPTAPSNLTATLIGSNNNSAELNWSTPSSNGGNPIIGYNIQRSLNGGSTWSTLVSDTGSTITVYTNTGLTLGQQYTYQVAAITVVGTGSYSNNASVQPSLITVIIAGTPQGGNSVVVTPTVSLTGPANINFVKVSLYKNHALTDSYLKTGAVASGALVALTSYPTVTSDFYVIVKFDTGYAVQSNTISLTPAAPFSGEITFNEDRLEYTSTTCGPAGGAWNGFTCDLDFTISDLEFTVQPVGADVIIKYQPQNLNAPPIVKAFTSTSAAINELTLVDSEIDYYGSIYVNPPFDYNINADGTIQIICDPTDILCDDSDIDPTVAGIQSNVPLGTPSEKTFKSFKDPNATRQLGIEPMGNLFGVNMVFIFVIALAGIFTGRSAPMGVIFIIVTLGIMAYLGYLDFGSDALNAATWGLLIISAILGIFLGKRWS